jgi:3-isopropylmalate dehydrogenase
MGTLVIMAGEGVGPEVVREARRVVEWFATEGGVDIDIREELYGTEAYERHGTPFREAALDELIAADAILFGATGGPAFQRIPLELRRRFGLLRLRRELGVYANLRPIRYYDALEDAVAVRPEVARGTDILVVRELNGGLYFGEPRGIESIPDGGRRAVNTLVYTTDEIRRIARSAFALARTRGGRLCSVDKSNVLDNGVLWREVVTEMGSEEFPDVALSHILVDNCAMQLVIAPTQFDVLLADNMFGDILSDIGGAIAGSLGMLASASFSDADATGHRRALYEPVHGSAPDIAGKGIANPIGAIASLVLALEHSFDAPSAARSLERAIEQTLAGGVRTPDIGGSASTTQVGDGILAALRAP